MEKKPWQAQAEFNKRSGAVKAPFDIRASIANGGLLLEWRRRPGKVDGFVIYFGTSPKNVREVKRVPCGSGYAYRENITGIEDGQAYYVTVMAYLGETASDLPEPLRVNPGGQVLPDTPEFDINDLIDTNGGSVGENSGFPEVPVNTPEEPLTGAVAAICGQCAGDVVLDAEERIFKCRGCQAKYVERASDGKLIPVAILQNGICDCCSPRKPLVKPQGEQYGRCSATGERYVELEGRLVKMSSLDYGLCTCCRPSKALMLNQQGQVVCSAKRDHLYIQERENGPYVYHPPEAPAGSFDEVNDALAGGSAVMLPGGIIANNHNNQTDRPKRRRR